MRKLGSLYINCLIMGIALLSTLYLFPSCVSNERYESLKVEYDSLSRLNVSYQQEAYVVDSLIAAVISSFQELSTVEYLINVNTHSDNVPESSQERLKRNLDMIAERLKSSNDAIDALIDRVDKGALHIQRLDSTVALLKRQLVDQRRRLETMAEEAKERAKLLDGRTMSLTYLSQEVNRLRQYNMYTGSRLLQVEDSVSVVHYAVGTKSDLQEMRLIKKGQLSVDNHEVSYLTKADRRTLARVATMSKKARLCTLHPKASYRFVPDNLGKQELEILDKKNFWRYSTILVIEVD